jgi:hypothetical protein
MSWSRPESSGAGHWTWAELPLADNEPLVAVASTEFPQPDRVTTSTLNDRFAVAPAAIGACVQFRPEHDQPGALDRLSSESPAGSEMLVVRPLVEALPGSDTPTLTRAVTPRLSTLFTLTDTPSWAFAATETGFEVDGVGAGDELGGEVGFELVELDGCGLGVFDGELLGFFDGLGEPDRLPLGPPGAPGERDDPGWPGDPGSGEVLGTGPPFCCGPPGWPPAAGPPWGWLVRLIP